MARAQPAAGARGGASITGVFHHAHVSALRTVPVALNGRQVGGGAPALYPGTLQMVVAPLQLPVLVVALKVI